MQTAHSLESAYSYYVFNIFVYQLNVTFSFFFIFNRLTWNIYNNALSILSQKLIIA